MTSKLPEGECEGLSDGGKLVYLHPRHHAAPAAPFAQPVATERPGVSCGGRGCSAPSPRNLPDGRKK